MLSPRFMDESSVPVRACEAECFLEVQRSWGGGSETESRINSDDLPKLFHSAPRTQRGDRVSKKARFRSNCSREWSSRHPVERIPAHPKRKRVVCFFISAACRLTLGKMGDAGQSVRPNGRWRPAMTVALGRCRGPVRC